MTDNRKFIDEALKAHNVYRSRHQVSALKHDKEISSIAQRWADHLASTGTFQHSDNRKYKGENLGENIAMKWQSGPGDYTGMWNRRGRGQVYMSRGMSKCVSVSVSACIRGAMKS